MIASFEDDNDAYEKWLRTQCDVVKADLAHKHERMTESAFFFLRATYFRWARTIEEVCPECADAPKIAAVGDIHIENYGVWRDREGRLVWGINDYDEAARAPYAYDLVRLAASAMLTPDLSLADAEIANAILVGYDRGLANPGPVLLDRDNVWMRQLVQCTEENRAKFWIEVDAYKRVKAPTEAREALVSDLPNRAEIVRFVKRRKGGGSLGKPRFAVIANWRGGALLREAKAVTGSAWNWAHGKGRKETMLMDLARSPSRAPDPFLDVRGGYLVRRLAPDSRKIEFDDRQRYEMTDLRVLSMMGQDLASAHAARKPAAIETDFKRRHGAWLEVAARNAVKAVEADYKAWCDLYRQANPEPAK